MDRKEEAPTNWLLACHLNTFSIFYLSSFGRGDQKNHILENGKNKPTTKTSEPQIAYLTKHMQILVPRLIE